MTGYQWRAKHPQPPVTPPGIRGVRLLTRDELESMPSAAKAARQAHWAGIIRGLEMEHNRLFHAHAVALDAAIRESRGVA